MSQMSYHPEEDKVVFSPENLSTAVKMRSIMSDSLLIENRRINKMLEEAIEPYISMIRKFIDKDDYELEAMVNIGDRRKLVPPSKMKIIRDTEPWIYVEFRWIPTNSSRKDLPVDFGDKATRVKRLLKKFSDEVELPVYVKEDE